jgi:hypothetical protein
MVKTTLKNRLKTKGLARDKKSNRKTFEKRDFSFWERCKKRDIPFW